MDLIKDGYFSPGNENEFKDITDMLLYNDRFLTLADYKAYISSQEEVSRAYRDLRLWSIGGGADEVMLGIICKLSDMLPSKQK